MFQLDTTNRAIIYRRPTGRLMRPSDRMMRVNGLGEVDGILDTLKNFGSGIVKFTTAGLYDPSKNRFFVPFSSGQMRNWAQGATNTATLGLVKTDKFFGSQTMRTIGTVAGAAAAGATAYFGGQALSNYFNSGSSAAAVGAPGAPGSSVFGPPTPSTLSTMSTSSLIPSLGTVKTGLEVLSLGSRVMGGGGAQLPSPGSSGAPVIIMNQPGQVDMGLGPVQPQQSYGYGYDPSMANTGFMPAGGGVYSGGGSGGGGGGGGPLGPPGSEFQGMQQQEMTEGPSEGMSMAMKLAMVGGVGLIAYMLFVKAK